MRTRPIRFALPCLLGALCAIGGVVVLPSAVASQGVSQQEARIDERIPEAEQEVLLSTLSYAMPEFDADVEWLGEEQPTFESLRGKTVVLHTWNSETTNGRAMARRVSTLLRKFGDDVVQIALHTPEGADEVLKKYERHSGRLPQPTAIDTKGVYLDELGIWKEPRMMIVDRDGRIRHAGVSLAELRDAVQETIDLEVTTTAMPEPLPARSERITTAEDGEAEAPVADAEWPAHNRIQAGSANNLQGQRGPALRVQKYVRGEEPETEGKVVMMEFWATWCGPCIAGIPHLNELQSKFKDDLVVVGISSEDEQIVRNKMRTDRRLDFEYTIAIDPQRRVQGAVGNRGIPHCIVLSSDGIVRWQGHPARLSEEVMSQIVAANRSNGGGGSSAGTGRWVTED